MITFLPSLDFEEAARMLDNRRLVNQLGETRFLLDYLINGFETRWKRHPLIPMWRGYEDVLLSYGYEISLEMRRRGYKESNNWRRMILLKRPLTFKVPDWLEDERIPITHKHALYGKRPDLYPTFVGLDKAWEDSVCCPTRRVHEDGSVTGPCQYFWPSHDRL